MDRKMAILLVAALLALTAGTASAGGGENNNPKVTFISGPTGAYTTDLGLAVNPATFKTLTTSSTSYTKSNANTFTNLWLYVTAKYYLLFPAYPGSFGKNRRSLLDFPPGTLEGVTEKDAGFGNSNNFEIIEGFQNPPFSPVTPVSTSRARAASRGAVKSHNNEGGGGNGCGSKATAVVKGTVGSSSWSVTISNVGKLTQVFNEGEVDYEPFLANTPLITFAPAVIGNTRRRNLLAPTIQPSCTFTLVNTTNPSSQSTIPSCVVVFEGTATRNITYSQGLFSTIQQFQSLTTDGRSVSCAFTGKSATNPIDEFPCGCYTGTCWGEKKK